MQVCCYCAALKRELEFARALQLASETGAILKASSIRLRK